MQCLAISNAFGLRIRNPRQCLFIFLLVSALANEFLWLREIDEWIIRKRGACDARMSHVTSRYYTFRRKRLQKKTRTNEFVLVNFDALRRCGSDSISNVEVWMNISSKNSLPIRFIRRSHVTAFKICEHWTPTYQHIRTKWCRLINKNSYYYSYIIHSHRSHVRATRAQREHKEEKNLIKIRVFFSVSFRYEYMSDAIYN